MRTATTTAATTATALSRVRNLGVLAHVDAGKTTTTERILFATGAVHRRGEVHDGTTVTDFDAMERDRGITIFAAAVSCDWAGHRLTLIDTPGHVDFSAEVERSLRVLDGAVAVFDAVAGVEPQSAAVWRQADRHRVARIAFVNKMDRVGADLDAAVDSIRERLHPRPLVVQLPIGREGAFTGVVDLVRMRSLVWPDDGGPAVEGPVPAELLAEAGRRRRALAEAVAELHVGALEEYAGRPEVSPGTLAAALRELTLDGQGLVVLCGSAYRNRGVEPLLDAVVAYLPSPLDAPALPADPDADLVALVFKVGSSERGRLCTLRLYRGTLRKGDVVLDAVSRRTERVGRVLRVQADRFVEVDRAVAGEIVAVAGLKAAGPGTTVCHPGAPVLLEPPDRPEPVVSVAVEARRGTDLDRLATALARLVDEDPSLAVRTDRETGQTLLSGLGELHLEVAVARIRRDHGLDVAVGRPRVAHREAVVRGVTELLYRHVRQDGGPGQFAHVVLDVEPLHAGEFEFAATVTGAHVPAEYVRAVEAGCRDALAEGPLGGDPVTGLRVTLTDGRTHVRDSSETAFRAAGRLGLREALRACGMVRLEPVAEVTVTVPAETVGGVLGDLAARRGRITDSRRRGATAVVTAVVPLVELFGYATRLRSRTQGGGTVAARPAGYAPVSGRVAAG
ncbi:elongation factor G [Pseudonocardia humida]|uniref:Elongation factor G n=1 Tax=Pseudonocardia humida TaxID=2800819 RepID=A0ABT0ZV02_9PSEU|nr:elongation factor G [Pseudonocardia humida]MCO1654538.1 elongation factor G [Pseudonocardia humida]